MTKKLFINCLVHETRVALVDNHKVVEYLIERPVEQRVIGNIYKGRVANVLPGMQAAFVDIGMEKNAFLYVDDIYPSKGMNKWDENNLPPIRDLVAVGDSILVQVNKEPVGSKGPRVTTNLSIPGRYLVYLPFGGYIGVSRRIEEELERERLKEIGEALVRKEEGLIIRTVCEGIDEQDLMQDLTSLRQQWDEIVSLAEKQRDCELLFQELDMIPKIVRDLMTAEMESCMVDDRLQYQRLKHELSAYPELRDRIHLYSGVEDIFDHYGISIELDRALRRKVWLKSGGYLIFDQTEALTVIDVNTGKYTGSQSLEETVLKTNIEAAKEIARQLRLRDIGGIIIIDFIDMTEHSNQQEVVQVLEHALKQDRTKSNVVGITSLGLVEMTRKKMRQSMLEVLSKPCTYCDGKGYTLSEATMATLIEQSIRQYKDREEIEALLLEAHPSVVEGLNHKRKEQLLRLERRYGLKLWFIANAERHVEEHRVIHAGSIVEVQQQWQQHQLRQGKK